MSERFPPMARRFSTRSAPPEVFKADWVLAKIVSPIEERTDVDPVGGKPVPAIEVAGEISTLAKIGYRIGSRSYLLLGNTELLEVRDETWARTYPAIAEDGSRVE